MDNFQNNFMNALQGGYDFGRQIKQQQDQSNFNRLAGQAYGAAPAQRQEFIGRAMAVDPQAASALNRTLQTDEETRNKTIANAARLLTTTPEQYRPALYQNIRGDLARYIPGMPEQYDQTVAQAAQSIADAYGELDSSTPAGLREFQGLTQGLPEEDVQRARRVKLGLDGRASSAGFSQVKFTDAQGRERVGVMNGKTGQIDLPDGTSFNPQTGGIAPTQGAVPTQANMEADIALANDLIASGIPEAQVDAFLASRGQRTQMATPAVAAAGGDAFTGRRKEDEAAAVTAAQEAAKLSFLPQELGARTDAAVDQAVRIEAGKTAVEKAAAAPAAIATLQASIDSIDALLSDKDLGSIVGLGSMNPLNQVPGTKARGLIARADQIAGQSFLAAFNQLKGGGAITEKEGDAATKAMARLDRSQSEADYKAALTELKTALSPALARAQRQAAGGVQAPTSAPTQRARNPQTGEVLVLVNGQWVPE